MKYLQKLNHKLHACIVPVSLGDVVSILTKVDLDSLRFPAAFRARTDILYISDGDKSSPLTTM